MKRILMILVFLLSISSVFSTNADLTFDIKENGNVNVISHLNYSYFKQEMEYNDLISKENGYWLFNFKDENKFGFVRYEIILPKNAIINFMKTDKVLKITNENDRIVLIGENQDSDIDLMIQYKTDIIESYREIILYLILFSAGVLIGAIIYLYSRLKKIKIFTYNPDSLTERQNQIIKLLKKKKKLYQYEIENELNFPKASVSRNVESLLKKGLIEKHNKGVKNIIKLKF